MNLNLRCTAPVGAAAGLHQKIGGWPCNTLLIILWYPALPSFNIIAYFDVRIIDSVAMNHSIIEYHLSMQSWWPGHI